MSIAYIYILGSSNNPDCIECSVPMKVNKKEIFFGPCKKGLRAKLKSYVDKKIEDKIYIIGLNASYKKNGIGVRKIVWAGRLNKVMTFKKAFEIFKSKKKYKKIYDLKDENLNINSPLHVEPIYDLEFVGYKHRGTMHKNCWKEDLVKPFDMNKIIEINDDQIKIKKDSKVGDVFTRDSCFLLENIFYAEGKGLKINDDILNIFKKEQYNLESINKFAIFGKDKNGNPNGKRGGWLEIKGKNTDRLIQLIENEKKNIVSLPHIVLSKTTSSTKCH